MKELIMSIVIALLISVVLLIIRLKVKKGTKVSILRKVIGIVGFVLFLIVIGVTGGILHSLVNTLVINNFK